MKLQMLVAMVFVLMLGAVSQGVENTRVSGVIRYADGMPAANVMVQLLRAKPIDRAESGRPLAALTLQRGGVSPDEEVVATARSGADGTFTFNVAPGAYSLLGGGGRAGFARQRIVVEAGKPLEVQLKTPRAQA